MAYNTGNAIGSTDARDLYDNAQNLDKAMNSTDPTWTDRFGVARPTFKGAESELNQKVGDAEAAAAQALGYMNTMRATSYGPLTEDPTTDPLGNPCTAGDEYFNTTYNLLKRFDGSIWRVPDINTENLASGAGSSMVGHGGQTVEAALNERLPEIGTYALLRAYTGPVTAFLVRGVASIFDGGAGVFRVDAADTTTADNGGTVLVDASGRRWKREFIGALRPEWFGAVGNAVDDDTVPVQECINAAGNGGSIAWWKKYRITEKLTIPHRGIAFIGESADIHGPTSVIQMDAASSDDQMLDFQNAGCTFRNIIFRGKGKAIAGSQIFTTARTDNIADIDLEFHNCSFFDSETIGTLTGRGLYISNSTVSTFVHGIVFNWPSTLIEGSNSDQKLNTGFRSIRFSNNRVHAGSQGYLFWNTNTNHEKIWGIQIVGNYIDTDCGLWRGTLRKAVISGNKHFNNNTVPFLIQTGFFIDGASVYGNEFNGMPDNGYAATKQFPNVIAGGLIKNLTFCGNLVYRTTGDCIVVTDAASKNIVVSGNVFDDVLLLHRAPTARHIVNLAVSGIHGVTFANNVITTSAAADAARLAGDMLVRSTGSAYNYVLAGNQYPTGWKLSNITPTQNKRNDYAMQIYDGNGASEQVVDLDFYPAAVIVNAITGAAAGSTRLQVFGSSTGTTEVELQNGSVVMKGDYNLSGARYMMIALP